MADPGADEVTVWIEKLSGGDEKAAHLLWEQYFDRMVRLARRKFDQIGINRRAADEEDIALSAMNSFYTRAADGQFCLGDRQELWKLLVTITVRKAYAELKRQKAKKRGAGQVRGESIFIKAGSDGGEMGGIGEVLGQEPTPELAALAAEGCDELLKMLGDDTLVAVAKYKLDGYTNEEIAEKLECVPRTVERKMRLIRDKWAKEMGSVNFDDPEENQAGSAGPEETE
jgi:DNA-directed RNA polymerase specialized sigma24 family protein